jgi:NAD(P)-dependent dehydrogenase (short-subunit alcohol dehydrogenase family)
VRVMDARLARDGFAVAVLDVNGDRAGTVAAEIQAMGRPGLAEVVDLCDVSAARVSVERIVEVWGRLDVLVNNAGIMRTTPILDITETEWDQVVDLNLKATFFCLQTAGRAMRTQGRGQIVNIASISGLGARPDHVHYAAAKAGIISLTRSAALALAPYGVTVNAICPGVVDTPMTRQIHADRGRMTGLSSAQSLGRALETIPLGRIAEPEDVAGTVAFLVSADASYLTGQTIIVDGGMLLRWS